MKTPDCVLWALTKKNNAFLKKFNHNQWSHNPLSKTNFHNASSAASTCSIQGAKRVTVDKENKKEKTKQVFAVVTKHKMIHGKKAHKKNSTSGVLVNVNNSPRVSTVLPSALRIFLTPPPLRRRCSSSASLSRALLSVPTHES